MWRKQKQNQQVEKENKVIRQFGYKKGGVSLDFSLRIDTTTNLKDFLLLLKDAAVDVEAQINQNEQPK